MARVGKKKRFCKVQAKLQVVWVTNRTNYYAVQTPCCNEYLIKKLQSQQALTRVTTGDWEQQSGSTVCLTSAATDGERCWVKIPSVCVCSVHSENSSTAAWEWCAASLIKQLLHKHTRTNPAMAMQGSHLCIYEFRWYVFFMCDIVRGIRESDCLFESVHLCSCLVSTSVHESPSFVYLHSQILSSFLCCLHCNTLVDYETQNAHYYAPL